MNKKFLFVIDDLDMESKSIIELLKNQGHQVELNNNLDSILSSYSKGMHHIIILELTSPGISELEFIKDIKNIDPLLQIIVLADQQSSDVAINALKYGAFYLLQKPINVDLVSYLLKNAIDYLEIKSENLKLKLNAVNGNEGHANADGNLDRSIASMEKQHIIKVLNENKWNISRSAQKLEIDRVTLYNKIKKYNLRKISN